MEIIIAFFLYIKDKRKQRFREKSTKKTPLMNTTNDDIVMCPICYNYQVNTVFLPCTHVSCYLCSKIIKNCHLCRRKILKTQFFKLP